MLAVGYEDGSVVFVDPEKGKELRRGKVSDAVNSLAFDALTGAAGQTLKGHGRPITSVTFAPDGKRIVSGSMDMTVRVWPQ